MGGITRTNGPDDARRVVWAISKSILILIFRYY